MQLLVRTLAGGTAVVAAEPDHTVGQLKQTLEASAGAGRLARRRARPLPSARCRADINLRLRSVQLRAGVPARHQCLVHSGRLLDDAETLGRCGLATGSTVHQAGRLCGGKPVKVKIITGHLPCGQEVTIDLEPTAGKAEIKRKLEAATGVPTGQQKVMLSGINQIVMGDRRWAHWRSAGAHAGLASITEGRPPGQGRPLISPCTAL